MSPHELILFVVFLSLGIINWTGERGLSPASQQVLLLHPPDYIKKKMNHQYSLEVW